MERPITITRHYVLAAGGTGGHMIPAHAVAVELMERVHRVALVTDDRVAKIPGLFDTAQIHVLPAGRMAGGRLGRARVLHNIQSVRVLARRTPATFTQQLVRAALRARPIHA